MLEGETWRQIGNRGPDELWLFIRHGARLARLVPRSTHIFEGLGQMSLLELDTLYNEGMGISSEFRGLIDSYMLE